jgi:hypothetical protein
MNKVIIINFICLGLIGLFRLVSKLFVLSPFRSHIILCPYCWYSEVIFASPVLSIHKIRFFLNYNSISYDLITDAFVLVSVLLYALHFLSGVVYTGFRSSGTWLSVVG